MQAPPPPMQSCGQVALVSKYGAAESHTELPQWQSCRQFWGFSPFDMSQVPLGVPLKQPKLMLFLHIWVCVSHRQVKSVWQIAMVVCDVQFPVEPPGMHRPPTQFMLEHSPGLMQLQPSILGAVEQLEPPPCSHIPAMQLKELHSPGLMQPQPMGFGAVVQLLETFTHGPVGCCHVQPVVVPHIVPSVMEPQLTPPPEQSCGQLPAFSPLALWQFPSGMPPMQPVPPAQSAGQVMRSSPGSHVPLGAPPWHAVQSDGQVIEVSPGSHIWLGAPPMQPEPGFILQKLLLISQRHVESVWHVAIVVWLGQPQSMGQVIATSPGSQVPFWLQTTPLWAHIPASQIALQHSDGFAHGLNVGLQIVPAGSHLCEPVGPLQRNP